LAEIGPAGCLWPADPAARAIARSMSAEMHSGFVALRSDLPMNCRRRYENFALSETAAKDAGPTQCSRRWYRDLLRTVF